MHKFATKSVFLIGDKLLVKYFPEAGRSPRDNGRRGSTLVQLSAPLRRCDPGSVPVCHPSARFRKRAASTPRHYLQRLCIKLYSPALTIIVTSCLPCPSSVRSSWALAISILVMRRDLLYWSQHMFWSADSFTLKQKSQLMFCVCETASYVLVLVKIEILPRLRSGLTSLYMQSISRWPIQFLIFNTSRAVLNTLLSEEFVFVPFEDVLVFWGLNGYLKALNYLRVLPTSCSMRVWWK